MNESFNAIYGELVDDKIQVTNKSLSMNDLPDEDVLIEVAYSTLNYKDGLGVQGEKRVLRTLPMVCGIDLAGTVKESRCPDYKPGDKVLINGWGLSETNWGGFSQFHQAKPEWLVRVPEQFSLEQTMALGTAGYTAMLCVHSILDHGIKPDDGEVLVTGAAGGVGSTAIMLLNKLGYEVAAATGRIDETGDFLKSLGASRLVDRSELSRPSKPMEKETWAAAVDVVGGEMLATVISQMKQEGIVAACGLAGGATIPTNVMPFILRGVTLRGINSVYASQERRQRAWDHLAELVDLRLLDEISETKPMSEVFELAPQIVAGKIRGRIVIDVNA